MTGEVLSHGDERHAGPGRALGVAVTLVLVAMAAVAALRSPGGEPGAAPSPSPAGPFPTGRPAPPRTFAEHVTLRRPPPGVPRTGLLARGLPGFLVPGDAGELPTAFGAVGGPDWSPVVVGWCAATGLFQDEAGRYFYDRDGLPVLPWEGPPLRRYAVRVHPLDPARIDVSADEDPRPVLPVRRRTRSCPGDLYRPALPPRADDVHDAVPAFRVVTGRYVVRTETQAFCRVGSDCAADGWEAYGLGTLPRGDLAGGYVWEGPFVVRGGTDGSLTAIALPGVRLLRRERVGAAVRVGFPHGTWLEDDTLHLLFNPFRHVSGDPPDDSPGDATPIQGAREWSWLMADERGGLVDYAVRDDVEVVLGPGLTGLGRPKATAETLERWLGPAGNHRIALWVVLDARDRVLRVVVAG